LKLTHLLFYNVGSHLAGGRELFLQRLRRIQVFADHVGLPLVPVDSNLDEFYSKAGLGFASTFTVRNVSAALVLQGGLKTYLYASGYRYQDCRVGQSRDIAIADPVLLPLL